MKEYLYCIVGRSGSGKDTIADMVCHIKNMKKVLSCTTRIPRNEKDYKNHKFLTVNDYMTAKENDEIVADTYFNENYYWTTKQQLNDADFYIIDIAGLKKLKELYNNKQLVTVFIQCDRDNCKQRMLNRGDPWKAVEKRLKNDDLMFQEALDFSWDLIIDNSTAHSKSAYSLLVDLIERKERGK